MSINRSKLLALLDQARWAPSGDNTQPWRFAITAATPASTWSTTFVAKPASSATAA
jgi:hypothetical protein